MSKPLTTEELAEIRETNTESPEWDPSDYVISRLLATIDKLEKEPDMSAEPFTDRDKILAALKDFFNPTEAARLIAIIDKLEKGQRWAEQAAYEERCAKEALLDKMVQIRNLT